ncbi:uncharacterized protein LOC115785191 [Archocentrus centrarchus]|uniref:uncharacterized protein LOC115785191 n=1 Tax=Archocentrus centrarchus TaxID=63155 RepID=UPI0011EA4541|nr:uncharacterized protein LOC115785191 [Archocentrus centrarchus]
MPRKNELSEALRSQIVDLHKAGKGYKIIARTLDIHRSTVRKIVYKWKRFSTVATLPRSGRPTKTSAKTKISEAGHGSTEPKDNRGGDSHHKKLKIQGDCKAVRSDAQIIYSCSSDTEATDEDPVADRASAGPQDNRRGGAGLKMQQGEAAAAVSSDDETTEQRDFNTIRNDEEIIYSYSTDTEATDDETVADHASAGPSDKRRSSSGHKMLIVRDNTVYNDGNTDSYSSDEDEDEDPTASHLSAGIMESSGGDPDYEMHQGETSSASSDDETTEDPTEQVFNGEKKIYAGSSVTMGALLLLLLAFIMRHGLSKAATKDLLQLLNFIVPGCVPKSLRFLKKHSTDYNGKTEIHFYCPRCTNYLGVDPGHECGVCQQSLNRKGLILKAYYFLVMPLEIQLRNLLARVHSKLGNHFTRDASFSDVTTGNDYKSERQDGSITLTFNCDGSPVFRSSKYSIWPILCTINELPYVERCKNVLLHTLWFGRGKPRVQSFLTPFINELQKLSTAGFCWKDENGSEHRNTVTAKICTCDAVARAMVQNFEPFNKEFGCGFCYHKGEMVVKGRGFTRVYPIQMDGCDLRHMPETVQLAESHPLLAIVKL